MEAQIEEEAKKEEVVQRSEEVQTIIDRMPDRKSTRLNSSHTDSSRMPSSA